MINLICGDNYGLVSKQNRTTYSFSNNSFYLAGFGWTGAQYVNRITNLEAKIGGLGETENEMKVIEERFASIETSVQFLEKEIDRY